MRKIVKIDIPKSIKQEKLLFEEAWFDKLQSIALYIFFSFAIILFSSIYGVKSTNSNEEFYKYLSAFGIILFAYIIYRKATEKKLFVQKSNFEQEKNNQILLQFAKEKSLEIYRQSKECLIFNREKDDLNTNYKKSMIFLLDENKIYFTIIQDGYRLNLPVLLSHYFLKKDIKKLFSKNWNAE